MEKERKSCMLKRKHYKEDIKKICNLFLTLLLLLVGAETTNAAVETFDFTKMAYTNRQEIKEVKGTNINITFNAIPTTEWVPNWNNNYASVVVYENVNSFNVATNHSNYLIWQIVITFRNKDNHYIMGSGNEVTGRIGTYSPKGNVTTWSGASNSVTFTNIEHNTWWIQKIEVSYSIGNGKTDTDPYTVGDINTFFYINRPPKEQRYIKGIVSKVGKYDSSAGTISYHLSDDGIDKNAIVVQGGKGLKDAKFTNQHQIARGDTLTVYGHAEEVGDSLVLQSPSLTSLETYKDQVTITSAGWATYVSHRPIDFSQTKGIQAFQTKYDVTTNAIVLTPVRTSIPANTAVVLKGDPGSYTFTNVASADPLNDNELTFYTADTRVTEERTVYVLSMKEGVCGFFPYAKGKSMPSYKGCLLIKKNTAAKPFYRVDAKTPTDIRSIKQLQSQAVRYNLAGERVSNRYKGIVIENGRKIIVK